MTRATPAAPSTARHAPTEPPDIETMRASVRRALGGPLGEMDASQMDALACALRGHMEALIPEVEAMAGRQPRDSIPWHCALACVGEARRKLRIGNGQTMPVRGAVVQKLARSVNALADHYENLGGTPT
ncbi:DUF6415 family natural product biosynthesis protein [Streptomyces sp. NPDC101165]|uniref:DUF6415 family natural product biosynthesis protein n=1 Tax=Streptomyces sp. NPDC101165 TaxID=3366119 RepID=UPI0037FBB552